MRIDIKDHEGQPRFTLHVDQARPQTVVRAEDGRGPAVTLDWDRAFDDEGRLRHCPVCGCSDLYTRKPVPRVTGFLAVIGAAVLALALIGSGLTVWGVGLFLAVLVMDIGWSLLTRAHVVCYRCRSEFRETPIPRGLRSWQSHVAQRYPQQSLDKSS